MLDFQHICAANPAQLCWKKCSNVQNRAEITRKGVVWVMASGFWDGGGWTGARWSRGYEKGNSTGVGEFGERGLARRGAAVKPVLEEALTLAGFATGDETFYAEVLIKVGPVKVFTIAEDFEVGALGGSAMPEARIPRDGNDEGAAVHKVNAEGIVGEVDGVGAGLLDFNG